MKFQDFQYKCYKAATRNEQVLNKTNVHAEHTTVYEQGYKQQEMRIHTHMSYYGRETLLHLTNKLWHDRVQR